MSFPNYSSPRGETKTSPETPFTGKGIGIAFLDTGISPVADFISPLNRIAAFRDFVNGKKEPYDDNGHGTHVTYLFCANRQPIHTMKYNKKPF